MSEHYRREFDVWLEAFKQGDLFEEIVEGFDYDWSSIYKELHRIFKRDVWNQVLENGTDIMAYQPINLEKLEKRVRELETDLPEKLATLKTENAKLRDYLNATIDTLNDVVKIVNEQVIAKQTADGPNPDFDDGVDRHHYLTEVNKLTQEEWNDLLKI